MAIWQYAFIFLPKKYKYHLTEGMNLEGYLKEKPYFDDSLFWKGYKLDDLDCKSLMPILCNGKSWSKDILLFGNIENNCVEILFNDGFIKTISFRIDFTFEYIPILEGIIKFCEDNDFIFIDQELNVYSPSILNFEKVIKSLERYKMFYNSK